jgi:hypothetical protein
MINLQVGTPLWTGRAFGCVVWLVGERVGFMALNPAGIPFPDTWVMPRPQAQWMALELAQAVQDGHVAEVHPGQGD